MNEIISTKQERKIDREMWNFEVSHTLLVHEKKKERKKLFLSQTYKKEIYSLKKKKLWIFLERIHYTDYL